jgi:hypothetical protein
VRRPISLHNHAVQLRSDEYVGAASAVADERLDLQVRQPMIPCRTQTCGLRCAAAAPTACQVRAKSLLAAVQAIHLHCIHSNAASQASLLTEVSQKKQTHARMESATASSLRSKCTDGH